MPAVKRPDANVEFYHRFTRPEELKSRFDTTIEHCSCRRWFLSPNLVKIEDYRAPGEAVRIVALLRQRKRDAADLAIARILEEARRKSLKVRSV